MKKHRFNKFYRVFRNDTRVTEVSFNDFKPVVRVVVEGFRMENPADELCTFPNYNYSLLPEKDMFYGYDVLSHAMEMAKAGALKHLAALIAEGPGSAERVYQYRFDHYEDLNVNLKDSAIKAIIN